MARIEKVDEKLIPVALELRRECLGAIRERGEERFKGEFSDPTEKFFKNGDQTTVLAFDGENPIGCATVCYFEVMPTVDHPSGKRAHIMNVYMRGQYAEVISGEIPKGYITDPYERQRGVIREMLSFILDEAKRRGVSYVSVNTNDRGRPVYKALGFGENKENMSIKFFNDISAEQTIETARENTVRIEKVNAKLIPMALKMRREMLGVIFGRDEESFEGEFSDRTEEFFRHGDQTTVIAFDGDTAVGCATICYMELMPSFDPSEKRAHIMNVYVRKEYRRRGIAREMLNFILDEAKRRGISYVSLDATEQGKQLYRALGFDDNHENMGINL